MSLGSTAIRLADVSVLKFQVFSGCHLSFYLDVPHGYILGSLLTNIFTDICNKITHSKFLIYAAYIEIFRAENSFGAYTQWQSDIDYIQGWILLILHSINSILIHPVLLNYTETKTKQTQHISIIQQCATRGTLLYNTKVFVWLHTSFEFQNSVLVKFGPLCSPAKLMHFSLRVNLGTLILLVLTVLRTWDL